MADRIPVTAPAPADAIVVGAGLVGLCCAAALARDGARVILLGEYRPGAASSAAAGMLAPSIERGNGPATDFAMAARDRYPAWLEWLHDATGIRVPLNRRGILRVAVTDAGVRGLHRAMARDADPDAEWLDAATLHALEPALPHARGAVLHPADGCVDTAVLLEALEAWCGTSPRIQHVSTRARRITFQNGGAAVDTTGDVICRAPRVVLAAGAWSPEIEGLPRRVPVAPLRGQMLAFDGSPLRHVVFGPRGYLVPRETSPGGNPETLVGATSEQTDFDASTTSVAAESLRVACADILPDLARATPQRQWAGLRPVTPDLLPIIGADPDHDALLYACGHSRNGVLMAPLTGDCISALARGEAASHDLRAFAIERFPSA